MNEILEQYGYKHTGQCNCDGFPTEKYRAGDFELRIREKKNLFRVKKLGHTITSWQIMATLEETLKEIHTNAAVQA